MAASTSPSYVLSGLKLETLVKLGQLDNIRISDTLKKSELVRQIAERITEAGVKKLVDEMKKEDLEEVVGSLDIDHESNNPHSKTVLKKRLMEKMIQLGVEDFAQTHMEKEQIAALVEYLGEKPAETKKATATQLGRLVNIIGVSAYFSKFDVSFLKDCMQDMKLKCQTDSKTKIVYAIATQSAAKTEHKEREEISFSKEKKALKKGITYQDVFQHYFLDELQDYCREHDLKISGTKPQLIKRILAFLEQPKTAASKKAAKEESEESEEEEEQREEEANKENEVKEAPKSPKGNKKSPKKVEVEAPKEKETEAPVEEQKEKGKKKTKKASN